MGAACSTVQPRANNGKSRQNMSFSTAFTASNATFQALPIGEETSCMKVATQVLSLERAYGKYNASSTTLTKHAAAITWAAVEINSHEVMLGDHPYVSSGPPITIEWDAFQSVKLTVAKYEECNPHHRSRGALLIPKAVREDWLRNQGYSRRELEIAIRSIHENKKGRLSNAADGRGWSKLFTRNKNAHSQGHRSILR